MTTQQATNLPNCDAKYKLIWTEDFSSLFDVSPSSIQSLSGLFLGYVSHQLHEQLLENKVDEFEILLMPLGKITLQVNTVAPYEVRVSDVKFDPSFLSAVINTIERKQSSLYETGYTSILETLQKRLLQFTGGEELQ